MKQPRWRRPSASLLISSAALVAALGALAGTAFSGGSAVPGKGGVKASDLARGAVKNPKLADGAVSNPKLADGAVSAAKLGAGAVTAGKLGTIIERTSPTTIPDDGTLGEGLVSSSQVTVPCLDSEKVIGGGFAYGFDQVAAMVAIRSSFREGNGWTTDAINDSGVAQTGTHIAYCLQP